MTSENIHTIPLLHQSRMKELNSILPCLIKHHKQLHWIGRIARTLHFSRQHVEKDWEILREYGVVIFERQGYYGSEKNMNLFRINLEMAQKFLAELKESANYSFAPVTLF